MRTGHNNMNKQRNRSRHRSSGGGGGSSGGSGGNPLSRIYDSNGPDVKVRGTAQTVAEKYLQLGRDAQVSGDYLMGESYFQFAEHYLRIVSAAQAYNQQVQPQFRRSDEDGDEDGEDDGSDTTAQDPRNQPQPVIDQAAMGAEQPREGDGERQPQQQPYRQQRDYRDQQASQRDQNPPRDQNGQPYGNRDRNKPRWQDRRDNNPPPPVQQSRPADEPSAPPPAPVAVEPVAEASPAQWEAPSFLRRPATIAQPAAETEAGPDAAPAAAPAPRKYVRKPRKEAAAETGDALVTTEPAGD